MSRTYKQKLVITNGRFEGLNRYTGNRIKPYCAIYHKTSLKFWYTQIGYDAKEKMRNANRSLNKRTRQYNKKQIKLGIKEWQMPVK